MFISACVSLVLEWDIQKSQQVKCPIKISPKYTAGVSWEGVSDLRDEENVGMSIHLHHLKISSDNHPAYCCTLCVCACVSCIQVNSPGCLVCWQKGWGYLKPVSISLSHSHTHTHTLVELRMLTDLYSGHRLHHLTAFLDVYFVSNGKFKTEKSTLFFMLHA